MSTRHSLPNRAFTLVEILVVIGILGLLAAILFPVFGTVRGRARQTACLSNLHQIGQAAAMYIQDNDSYYPRAADAADKASPSTWGDSPEFQAELTSMPTLQEVLAPYVPSRELFHCPSDVGFAVSDFNGVELDAFPSSYEKFGSSYYYRTEFAAHRYIESQVNTASKINFIFDGCGRWHGTFLPIRNRYNVLFADLHAKNISGPEMDDAWAQPVTAQP
jgi:general secretion pathway protein G